MKQLKKITAMLLAVCIICGMLPAMSFVSKAAGDTIYILAGGDFQEAGDHANSAENVTNILSQISAKYTTMDGFLFIGDYDCETHNDATETANGISALMGAVQGTYSNINHENSILVQGNHDYMDSNIDTTGGHDFDGYSVFVLNEDDYPDAGGNESDIKALATQMKTWLDGKIDEGYDAPIFITSHLPLAFGPRTNNKGDGKYAKYLFDVLNEAGEMGLNIIFMHGHDHAYGADNYLGGEAIYLPKGDKINIAEVGSQTAWTEETLNFTYMNAGYTGYYNESGYNTTEGTDKLTMTVFAITDSEVKVERYSASGLYNLKSAGRDGYYSDESSSASKLGLAYNTVVYGSPQTILLTTVEEEEEVGTINKWVEVPGEVPDDYTPSLNGWVTVTEPVEGTPEVPATTTYQYTLDTDGTVNDSTPHLIVGSSNEKAMGIGNGSLTAVDTTISGSTATMDSRDYEWKITSDGKITNETYWLAASPKRNSCVITLTKNEDEAYSWAIVHTGNGAYNIYATYSGNSSRTWYLRYSNNSFSTTRQLQPTVRLYAYTKEVTTEGTPATKDQNGLYGKLVGETSYTVTKGITADEAMAKVKAGLDGYYCEAMSTPGTDVAGAIVDDSLLTWEWGDTFDGNTPGDYAVKVSHNGVELGTAEVIVPATSTWYIAEGNGLYTVDMNTSADDALAVVKAGVKVSSASDSDGTNKTEIDDSLVTWTWVDTYRETDNGPYTVEIFYNGTSLGTVEVKVDVQYESGLEDWTYVGQTEAAGGSHTYTLDTDGIDYGSENKYIIVARNESLALNATSTAGSSAETITISGNTATTTTRDYEYYFVSGVGITKDGTKALYQSSWLVRYDTATSHADSVLNGFTNLGNGYYRIYDTDGTERSLFYIDGTHQDATNAFTVTSSNHTNSQYSVRLYKYTGTTGGTPASDLYAKMEGNTTYTVTEGSSATKALNAVKTGITGYISSNADGSESTEIADGDLTWKWLNTYKGQVEGSYWVEISYNDEVLGVVEVKVEPGVVNNYPEYPNEGAVKVNKTATGIDFQSSGIAQVELSASGVAVKRGADVILMLDTSSSMTSHTVTGTNNTRAEVLETSLENLIAQFKAPGDDGEVLDIRVAIADFNGFYGENQSVSGTAYDRDAADIMSDDVYYNASSEAKVYTGDGTLGEGAFVDVGDLADSYTLNYTSGTNYDYAMDAIYQLGSSIKSEERDLFVIFMSDGAAMQWNYYHSQGPSSLWNKWITGEWESSDLTTTNLNCTTHAYYYDEVDHDGDGMLNEHRMANAIKGSSTETYEVIRKTSDLGTATGEENMYMVPGLDATMFSISFDAQADDQVTEASMDKSIESLATDKADSAQYYYKVTSADELTHAFQIIGSGIAYAATNARFIDQLGDAFNLQLETSTYTVVENGVETEKTLTPVIEVLTYDIYTKAEADAVEEGTAGDTVTNAMIGNRKGTYTLQEVVKFSDDGTKAYSNKIDVDKDGNYGVTINSDGTYSINDTDDNILGEDGVIYARTFAYNTGINSVWVNADADDTTGTDGKEYQLDSKAFYWKMGMIITAEMTLRYYVYLEGSREGTTVAGSYATNEYATLYYDNYLGNECVKDTVSPTLAWESANVSFAFYLVNEEGQIVVNQTTGLTGSFANKIAVTNPVVYKEILLNNTETLSVEAISDDVLPSYYELYDNKAKYEVTINSDSTGSWEITKGGVEVNSTYVTQYKMNDASAYSNELSNDTVGDDYTHTIVWFAVVWKVQAHPDSVVIDYGLPVDISVLTNDMFGEYGKLAAVGPYTDGIEDTTAGTSLESGFGSTYESTYGNAIANTTTGKIRYELKKTNGMQMQTYDKFAYAVNYSGTENAGYYYDTVTVIPATSVYYEDDYVTLESFTWDYTANSWTERDASLWETVGETVDGVQDEERPGKYSLTDANNIYGYDSSNLNMSTFSMGSAKKATVDYDNMAKASFEFYGTGFDVISMTSNETGLVYVDIYNDKGDLLSDYCYAVDTYYGYTQNADGEWVVDADSDDALYQIPIIKIDDLTYGKYRAEIRAAYSSYFDHVKDDGSYDFYLDAIRIYDPTNMGVADDPEDKTIENAYMADGEGWPSYMELRNQILTAESFDDVANEALSSPMEGLVFIDGDASVGDAQIEDYQNYGPNNEVYIAPGQRVAFMLDTPGTLASVQIGIKSADGVTGTYTITNIAKEATTDVKKGTYYGARTYTINTTTDMYYDLTGWKNDIIVISNTGDRYDTTGVISITNIKSTYTSDPNSTTDTEESGAVTYMYMTAAATALTLRTLNTPVEEVLPEENTPEISTPTESVPTPEVDSLKPEVNNSEVSVPQAGTSETNVSETTGPNDSVVGMDKLENAEVDETISEETKQEESERNDAKDSEVAKEELEEAKGSKNIIQMIIDFIKALFEWLFGWLFG